MSEEIVDGEVITDIATTNTPAFSRAEIDVQIATAKKYPRSIQRFLTDSKAMAILNPTVALSCFYTLPRAGKKIIGPSVRLAEILMASWGNLRVGARVVDQDARFLTAQGVVHDLERNVGLSAEVKVRITDKGGRTYSDDMIVTTANAIMSKALRNAVLRVIPKVYWQGILDEAMDVAMGKKDPLETTVARVLEYSAKKGVSEARLLAAAEKPSVADLDHEDVFAVKLLFEAVKNGECTLDQAFPGPVQPDKPTPPASRTQAVAETLAAKAEPPAAKAAKGKKKDPDPAPAAPPAPAEEADDAGPIPPAGDQGSAYAGGY